LPPPMSLAPLSDSCSSSSSLPWSWGSCKARRRRPAEGILEHDEEGAGLEVARRKNLRRMAAVIFSPLVARSPRCDSRKHEWSVGD
jgi:hypothetical protein